jgi:serine/threonine-protein kinase PpkA
MPQLKPLSALVLALLLAALLLPAAPAAQERRPLLIEGKRTLFQRVLTRPGAVARAAPEAGASVTLGELTPFSLFYVYARQDSGGEGWLEVGRSLDGTTQGWLRAREAIDWKQTIVVGFANPAGRERTLLFDSRDKLVDLLEAEFLLTRSEELRAAAIAGALPPDSGVVSIEPESHIDITRQFYLLPILEAERVWLASGFQSQILRIASIPLDANPLERHLTLEELLRDFNVGVVFVIDTTLSMGPYIERTREAVRRIYERIAGSEIGERVSFGLVAFRDNIELVRQLDYLTRTYVPLARGQEPARVLDQIRLVQESPVSSRGWNEDAMAGVHEAIVNAAWGDFGGRYIILVTDAGPRSGTDPYAHTGMAPREVNRLARDQGIAIYALHLRTPAGRTDHDYAAAAYRDLAKFNDAVNLYYPVPEGSVAAFGAAVDALADMLIGQVNETIAGRLSEAAAEAPEATAIDQAGLVGLAMQLAYLGRREGTRAPDVFEAWLSDRDLSDPRRAAVEARLMLSKNQLSTMRDVLKTLVESFEGDRAARMDAGTLFAQLRSAVALMSRDQDRVVNAEFETLGDALGEYLEDLPYTSEVMDLDEASWAASGGIRQREIIDGLKSKLVLYERYHNEPGLWTDLHPGAPPGEAVFAMPLDALP